MANFIRESENNYGKVVDAPLENSPNQKPKKETKPGADPQNSRLRSRSKDKTQPDKNPGKDPQEEEANQKRNRSASRTPKRPSDTPALNGRLKKDDSPTPIASKTADTFYKPSNASKELSQAKKSSRNNSSGSLEKATKDSTKDSKESKKQREKEGMKNNLKNLVKAGDAVTDKKLFTIKEDNSLKPGNKPISAVKVQPTGKQTQEEPSTRGLQTRQRTQQRARTNVVVRPSTTKRTTGVDSDSSEKQLKDSNFNNKERKPSPLRRETNSKLGGKGSLENDPLNNLLGAAKKDASKYRITANELKASKSPSLGVKINPDSGKEGPDRPYIANQLSGSKISKSPPLGLGKSDSKSRILEFGTHHSRTQEPDSLQTDPSKVERRYKLIFKKNSSNVDIDKQPTSTSKEKVEKAVSPSVVPSPQIRTPLIYRGKSVQPSGSKVKYPTDSNLNGILNPSEKPNLDPAPEKNVNPPKYAQKAPQNPGGGDTTGKTYRVTRPKSPPLIANKSGIQKSNLGNSAINNAVSNTDIPNNNPSKEHHPLRGSNSFNSIPPLLGHQENGNNPNNARFPRPHRTQTSFGTRKTKEKVSNAFDSEHEKENHKEYVFPMKVYHSALRKYTLEYVLLNFLHGLYAKFKSTPTSPPGSVPVRYHVCEGNNGRLVEGMLRCKDLTAEEVTYHKSNIQWSQLHHKNLVSTAVRFCPKISFKDLALTDEFKSLSISESKALAKQIIDLKLFRVGNPQLVVETLEYGARPNHIFYMVAENLNVCNHIKGIICIGHKTKLAETVFKYAKNRKIDPFTIIPKTYLVRLATFDSDMERLFAAKKREDGWKHPVIIKPGENTNRGIGIAMGYTAEETTQVTLQMLRGRKGVNTAIIQHYITNPLLYQKRKFDIRCYGLVVRLSNRTMYYWYGDGYARTSSFEFNLATKNNLMVHLTNEAVQVKGTDLLLTNLRQEFLRSTRAWQQSVL